MCWNALKKKNLGKKEIKNEEKSSFVPLLHILLLFKDDLFKTAHFNHLTVKNEKLLAMS